MAVASRCVDATLSDWAYRQVLPCNTTAREASGSPDPSRHSAFCDALNAESIAVTGQRICKLVALAGGYHAPCKERDPERREALDTVNRFCRSNSGE
jgi:hypothetical protein